jgi:nitroimidazol reductase NimA-like FMN-containing flavoprotein (pyridoxamine 5'-phosphate oxidase superfamily)
MSFHVLRQDREITDPEIMKSVLRTTRYVTVALCMDNEPYLVSLSHGYDEKRNCLYFHCANQGKKLTYALANNKVWGQAVQSYSVVDECDYTYISVHFSGRLLIVSDAAEKQHAMEVMVRQVSPNPESKLATLKPEKLATTTMGRIDIEAMTGKQHLNPKIK